MKNFLIQFVLWAALLFIVGFLGVVIHNYSKELWYVFLVICLPLGAVSVGFIEDLAESIEQ